MLLPVPIRRLIESFEKLPGIGPKTAARLTFYLLHVPQAQLDDFSEAVKNLKIKTVLCSLCFNVSETDPCPICADGNREKTTICVVEQPLDLLAIEKTGKYQGVYHVLHGAISPLNNIGPDELYIRQLIERVENNEAVREIILACNPNMEGEATSMYIARQLKPLATAGRSLVITRLGQGLPTGADIEYADETTISRALEGRREF